MAGRLFGPRHPAWVTLPGGAVSPGWHVRELRTYPVRITGTGIDVWIDGGR
ncbi:hypothetical protein [Methylobacterium sp. Leaf117]|uniref:hypothetical protein n=1 Tax=Methylobacterium sp. Leaf117 TaxID=1736260 RepID=UPI0012E0E538|nr:hypothetical protein [Methylobacterium sp. Leaf117]